MRTANQLRQAGERKRSPKLRTFLAAGSVWVLLLGAGAKPAPAGGRQATGQQNPTVPGAARPTMPSIGEEGPPDDVRIRMQAEQARSLNAERHKRLLADSERLVQLSTELKAEVEKANKDELSLTVMNKAAEIERLAHDVHERMKE